MKHLVHFCNLVEAAGKTCTFFECKKNCKAEEYAMRDQILIGTNNETIRERAMLKNWNLQELCQNRMKYESAATGEERTLGAAINKLGSYSYCSIKKNNNPKKNDYKKKCYSCALSFIPDHVKEWKAINSKCFNYSKVGHFAKVCRQQKTIKVVENKSMDDANSGESGSENEIYQSKIWKIKLSQNVPKFNIPKKHDFKKHLFINNRVVKTLIDTGAKVLVCRMTQARSWGILHKLKPSTAKIHPYYSIPIKFTGTALCSGQSRWTFTFCQGHVNQY